MRIHRLFSIDIRFASQNVRGLFVVLSFVREKNRISFTAPKPLGTATVYRKIGTHSFDGIELNHFI